MPTLPTRCLPYGTTTYDRVGLQTELDKIAADDAAGTEFGIERALRRTSSAACSCSPTRSCIRRFSPADFAIVRDQAVGALAGEMNSPDHLAEVALDKALYPAGDPAQRFATPQSVELADAGAT